MTDALIGQEGTQQQVRRLGEHHVILSLGRLGQRGVRILRLVLDSLCDC